MGTPESVQADHWIHVVRFDVAHKWRDDFLGWYRETHLPLTLEREGWHVAHLYECIEGEPRSWWSSTSRRRRSGPSRPRHRRWRATPRTIGSATTWAGRCAGCQAAGTIRREADLINFVTTEVRPAAARAFNSWYEEIHVPEITACPGWLGNERYEGIDGEPRFAALYGLTDEERPFDSAQFGVAVGWDQFLDDLIGYHGFRIFRRSDRIDSR